MPLRKKIVLANLILFLLGVSASTLKAQVFFNDHLSRVYKAEFTDLCNITQIFTCTSPGAAQTDIAYFNDTLYLVDAANNAKLYRAILTQSTPQCTLLGTFSHWVTSLAVDSLGVVYAAGEKLSKYTPSTNSFTMLGAFPTGMYSGGDLTYFKGVMYMYTGTNTLVQVDVNNPGLSTLFMTFSTPNIYGGITLPKSCNSNSLYAISNATNSNVSKLIEIDMDTKTEVGVICTYARNIWGAGSFVGSPPTFDSIKIFHPCTNEGNNGSIKVKVKQPNSSLIYTLNGTTSNNTGVFSNLGPGTYAINVSNGIGCVTDSTVSLSLVQSPTFSVTPINPNCNNVNGKIGMNPVSSTTNGYQYSLNTGPYQFIDTFRNLSTGSYQVQLVDTNGCTASTNTNLVLPTINKAGISITSTNTSCGLNNGSIQVTTNGVVMPVTYRLNNVPYNSGNFNGLAFGPYALSVIDGNLCRFDTSILILPSTIAVIDSIVVKRPCGSNDGRITVYPQVSNGSYTYYLNGSPNTTGIFNNIAPATYTIRLEKAPGCFKDSTINMQAAPLPTFNAVTTQPTCIVKGEITMQAISSQSLPILFSLNGGSYTSGNSFNNLVAGNYTVTAQNQLGCTTSQNFVLTGPVMNVAGINITSTNETCSRSNARIIATTSNVLAPVYFELNGSPSTAGTFANLANGSYKVSVIDGNKCRFDSTLNIKDILPIKPTVQYSLKQPTCDLSADGSIQLNITGSEGPYKVSLNNSIYSSFNFQKLNSGLYSMFIKNNDDCNADTLDITLKANGMQNCDTIFFPSAFTPNNDGKNDIFKGVSLTIPEHYSMTVYNRYGQKVFETKDFLKGWDGKINGITQAGTFVWLCNYNFIGQPMRNAKGTLVLLN